MILELNKEEANAIASLLDIAVKSAGLQVAEAALVILKKLAAAEEAEKNAPATPNA